jgi:hypothetical protein
MGIGSLQITGSFIIHSAIWSLNAGVRPNIWDSTSSFRSVETLQIYERPDKRPQTAGGEPSAQ